MCRSLGLTPFDLAPTELKTRRKLFAKSAETKSVGREEKVSDENELEKKKQIVKQFDNYDSIIEEESNQEENSISSLSPYSSSFSQLYIRERSISTKSNETSNVFDERLDDEAVAYIKIKGYNKQRPSAVVADKNNLLNAEYASFLVYIF